MHSICGDKTEGSNAAGTYPHLGCGAELVPEVVVEGVTVPRNASTERATLQNMVRGECFHGRL